MLNFNVYIIILSSLFPLLIGAIWYHPAVFGKKHQPNTDKRGHNPIIYILAWILSFMYSVAISYQVIHQLHFQSMFYNEVGFLNSEGSGFKDFSFIMDIYRNNFRTFGHGAFHGFLNSIFIVFPIIGINGLFENKPWKELLINWGYWATCGILMGGIICEFY